MLPRFQLNRIRKNLLKQRRLPTAPVLVKPLPVGAQPSPLSGRMKQTGERGGWWTERARDLDARHVILSFPFTVRFNQEWLPTDANELAQEGVAEFVQNIAHAYEWISGWHDWEISWDPFATLEGGKGHGFSELYGRVEFTLPVSLVLQSSYPKVALATTEGLRWLNFEEELQDPRTTEIWRQRMEVAAGLRGRTRAPWPLWSHPQPMDRFADTQNKPPHLRWLNADPHIDPVTIVEPNFDGQEGGAGLSGTSRPRSRVRRPSPIPPPHIHWVEYTVFSGIFPQTSTLHK